MRRPTPFEKAGLLIVLFLIYASTAQAQSNAPASSNRSNRFIKAFVVDDRLSALRRDADMQSEVIQRLRLGRQVFIIATKAGRSRQPDLLPRGGDAQDSRVDSPVRARRAGPAGRRRTHNEID